MIHTLNAVLLNHVLFLKYLLKLSLIFNIRINMSFCDDQPQDPYTSLDYYLMDYQSPI